MVSALGRIRDSLCKMRGRRLKVTTGLNGKGIWSAHLSLEQERVDFTRGCRVLPQAGH